MTEIYLYTMFTIALLFFVVTVSGNGQTAQNIELFLGTNEEVRIESPGYPNASPVGTRITWVIITKNEKQITFYCEDLRISASTDCESGYLKVINGITQKKHCSSSSGLSVRTAENILDLEFYLQRAIGVFSCIARSEDVLIGETMNAVETIDLELDKPSYTIRMEQLPQFTNFKWIFETQSPNRIGFYCQNYNLQYCEHDKGYLILNDFVKQEKFCHHGSSKGFVGTGNRMEVTLETGGYLEGYIIECVVQAVTGENALQFKNIASEEIDSSEFGIQAGPRNTTCNCGWSNQNRGRIVRGELAKYGQYPWAVSLNYYGEHSCGGALITEYHVLTAAHCVVRKKAEGYLLYLGTVDKYNDKRGKRIPVSRIIMHEEYYSYSKGDDIAILVAAEKISFTSTIGPACLTSKIEEPIGQYVVGMGWGNIGENEYSDDSVMLLRARFRVLDYKVCAIIRGVNVSNPNILCTWAANRNVCNGDSGSPVVWLDPETNRYTLLGLVSTGDGCKVNAERPSVHTFVPYHHEWIQKTIRENNPEATTCQKI